MNARALVFALAAIALSTVSAAPAAAQDRVPLTQVPDYDYSRAIEKKGSYLELLGGVAGGMDKGNQPDISGQLEVFAQATAALKAARTTWARAKSQVVLPFLFDGMDGNNVVEVPWGRHVAEAQLGLLMGSGPKHGFNLAVGTEVNHSGEEHIGVRPAYVGQGPFYDVSLWTELTPKMGIEDSPLVMALPIRYSYKAVGYNDDTAIASGHVAHRIEGGIGLQPRLRTWLEGWAEIIGVAYEHATLDDRTQPMGHEGRTIHKVEIHAIDMNHTVLALDGGLININTSVGGCIMWDDRGREIESFVGEVGLGAETPRRVFQLGFSLGNECTFAADASRLLEDLRVEAYAMLSPSEFGVGGMARVASSWLTDATIESPEDSRFRIAFHAEIYVDPFEDLFRPLEPVRVGIYDLLRSHLELDQAGWDPWLAEEVLSNELGLFVRYQPDLR